MKLETARLLLKPPTEEDIDAITAVASDWRVAEMTLMPHPYCADDARAWIQGTGLRWQEHGMGGFAVFTRHGLAFIGAIGIRPTLIPGHASTGYWFCPSIWGRGFATEALREIFRFGFEVKNLDRIEAEHLAINPASGRVMEKAGMREHVKVDLIDRDGERLVPGIRRYIHAEEWRSSFLKSNADLVPT
ncbi:GNAT family N-acetyltransferase [Luteolibacter luteus]|uniref:GNAT family N-acetyltransferase n=1 Tax=Luteolibacter luteus TaxID=2728835 RepID=A0A858RLY0_9BACT|nr:GNAT family N-acetyltransferase [Luteolibacter luteus]QJE97611.1 GNAT family N-acetyltransferase [Luteolibacter luteus]